MQFNPAHHMNDLIDQGIIKNAYVNMLIDKNAIADRLKKVVEGTLFGTAVGSAIFNSIDNENPKLAIELASSRTDPHLGLIELHTDRVIEQLEFVVREALKLQTEVFKENGVDSFAKIIAHDDGGKYTLRIRKSTLEQFKSGQVEIDGIIDPSDVPTNRDEMKAMERNIVGLDQETGKMVVDGQSLLKFLQALVQDKQFIEGGESPIDRHVKALQLIAQYIPALQARTEGEDVVVELDMAKLKEGMSNFLMNDLNKIKGIDVIPPHGEEPSIISIQVDYKALADQTMQVVADKLTGINGVRVLDNFDDTNISFSTDLRNRDSFVNQVQSQLGEVVAMFGREIADGLKGAKPPTLISSVTKHFLKTPDSLDLDFGSL